MTALRAVAIPLGFSMLSVAVSCSCSGDTAAQPPARTVKRFYTNEPTRTTFSYEPAAGVSTTWLRMMKIASGGRITLRSNDELIARIALTGIDTKDRTQDQMTATFTMDLFKNGLSFSSGVVVRHLGSCPVRAVVYDNLYQSTYDYSRGPNYPPMIKTTELKTGALVGEARAPQSMGDGSFIVDEIEYRDGKEIFRAKVRRHVGTGLMISEVVVSGTPETDYQHFELVLGNWSLPSS